MEIITSCTRPSAAACTWMVKNMGPRLREFAPAARGSQDARSRNLGPTFLTIPVQFPLEQAPLPPPAVVIIVVVHGHHLGVDVLVVVVIVVIIIVVVIVVVGVDDLRDEVSDEQDRGDHAEHTG